MLDVSTYSKGGYQSTGNCGADVANIQEFFDYESSYSKRNEYSKNDLSDGWLGKNRT
ncbi:unnamed protein product [marine sediment metagenome]|uniref:Uncharacterized protein n=1 Tax=marine sediment metagenome TaxID=412755 RepID=X1N4A8_9ZZZZ